VLANTSPVPDVQALPTVFPIPATVVSEKLLFGL
jgi:hypothetical protein